MDLEEAMRDLGFVLSRRARGADHYTRQETPFLTYTVQALADGTALFTWELAIAEYMASLGMQVGSGEHLNTFLFPREDARGPQDPAWVSAQIERTEALLSSVSFLDTREVES